MSFRVWFVMWCRSFYKLLMSGTKRQKSESQRKKERERRLKAKHSNANYYHIKKKRAKRRSSHHVQDLKMIEAIFGFAATSLGILLLPFGLLHWGYQSAKSIQNSRGRSVRSTVRSTSKVLKSTQCTPKATSAIQTNSKTTYTETKQESYEKIPAMTDPTPISKPIASKQPDDEPSENKPKLAPKNEKDQYIRKRMIIAGSSYCDKDVLERLRIGSYLEIRLEPDNPYDKNAVKLSFEGEKVGYIAKADQLPFVTCLKLGRKVYGVITDIIDQEFPTKYEYETWFESK